MSSHASPYDDDDDYRPRHRSPSRRSRDYSPDYHSGGSRMTGAIPPPIIPVAAAAPYDGPTPFYPPPPRISSNSLQIPYSPTRPRSQPPFSRDRDRSRDRSRDRRDRSRDRRNDRRDRDRDTDSEDDRRDRDRDRPRSPLGKAKHLMQHTFSDSTSGLGVGVMGAIIGGLAAREATEAAARKGKGGRSRRGSDANQGAALLSTIVGAAVGGLGANALEKRIEKSRNKAKDEQGRWEKKFGKDGKDGDARRDKDTGRDRSRDRDGERRERELALDMEEGRMSGRVERRRGDSYDDDSEPDYVYDKKPRRRRRSEE